MTAGTRQTGRAGTHFGDGDPVTCSGFHPPDGHACPSVGDHDPVEVPGFGDGQGPRRTCRRVRTHRLDNAGLFTFRAADALVLNMREGGRVVPVHAMITTGVDPDGQRLGVSHRRKTAPADRVPPRHDRPV